MYLELSAMHLLELHRAFEADRRRELREAIRRGALLEARDADDAGDPSAAVRTVSLGDRTGRVGDSTANLRRGQDLDPSPGT